MADPWVITVISYNVRIRVFHDITWIQGVDFQLPIILTSTGLHVFGSGLLIRCFFQ